MNNIDKIKYLTRQLDLTQSQKRKNDLQRGINKLNKKIRKEKIGMRKFGDNCYIKEG